MRGPKCLRLLTFAILQRASLGLLVFPTTAAAKTDDARGNDQRCVSRAAPPKPLTDEQLRCVGEPFGPLIREVQNADPAIDAKREAAEGDFRFLRITGAWTGPAEPGIACVLDTPATLARGDLFFIDVIFGEGDILYRAALEKYATVYNRALVSHPSFPYPDICGIRTGADKGWRSYRSLRDFVRKPSGNGLAKNLHAAARNGDANATERLLAIGGNPNEVDIWGFTPVGWSVLTRNGAVLSQLIAAHADPNMTGERRPTPLNLAINSRSLSLVRQLIAAGANVNTSSAALQPVSSREDAPLGGTPLWVATKLGEVEIVSHLIGRGADPNYRRGDDQTAIFAAIANRRSDLLRMLIEHKADVRVRDGAGIAPIQAAAERRYPEGVRLIASAGGLADARSKVERDLWRAALETGLEDILMTLVAVGANANLLKTSERGLLRKYIAANRKDEVLKILARADKRAAALEGAIKQGDLQAVQDAYSNGAEIDEGRKRTGLIAAVQARRPNLVRWFLERGADPLAPMYPENLNKTREAERSGESPLDRQGTAVSFAFEYGPIETVRLLLSHVRNLPKEKPTSYWGSRLHRAFFGFRAHNDPRIIEQAVELVEEHSKTGPQADAFLHEVCFWTVGSGTGVLEAWLLKGYRPRQKNDPERIAAYPGDDPAFNECLRQSVEAALLMLKHGADPQQLDSVGDTPLGSAIEQLFLKPEYVAVVRELLVHGADPNQPNAYGRIVLDDVRGRLQHLDREQRAPFAEAESLLVKRGAKTRAQLEKEGVLKPVPVPPRPIPVR